MPIVELAARDRRNISAAAHHLDPVVIIGAAGLTANVLHEIDNALTAHELIKVRAVSDEREERSAWLLEICDTLSASPIKHIGKLFIIYREKPDHKPVVAPVVKPKRTLRERPAEPLLEEARSRNISRRARGKTPVEGEWSSERPPRPSTRRPAAKKTPGLDIKHRHLEGNLQKQRRRPRTGA